MHFKIERGERVVRTEGERERGAASRRVLGCLAGVCFGSSFNSI